MFKDTFVNDCAGQRARAAKAASVKTRYRGRKPHPSNTMDAHYTADQFAFLKALDAWRRRTLATAPDAAGVAEIMLALGYSGGPVPRRLFNEEVESWRQRNGRRFPPATALFDLFTGPFGFQRKEARP